MRLARRLLPFGAQQGYVFHDGQARLGEQSLHHVLVHARRRAQHPRPHICDPRQLKQPLDRSILPESPVQHRENHVQRRRAVPPALDKSGGGTVRRLRRKQCRDALVQKLRSGSGLRIARAQPPRPRACIAFQKVLRFARRQPVPFLGDADRHHLKLPPIDRLQYRRRREQRHLMLPAPPPKQHTHPQFSVPSLYFRFPLFGCRKSPTVFTPITTA